MITTAQNEVLLRTGPIMFLAFVLAGLSILELSRRKEGGWYLAFMTGLLMIAGAFPAHYIRDPSASLVPKDSLPASIFTSTYWMAGAQGVILVLVMLLLRIRSRDVLYDESENGIF